MFYNKIIFLESRESPASTRLDLRFRNLLFWNFLHRKFSARNKAQPIEMLHVDFPTIRELRVAVQVSFMSNQTTPSPKSRAPRRPLETSKLGNSISFGHVKGRVRPRSVGVLQVGTNWSQEDNSQNCNSLENCKLVPHDIKLSAGAFVSLPSSSPLQTLQTTP